MGFARVASGGVKLALKISLTTAGGEAGHHGFWRLDFAARRSRFLNSPFPLLRLCRPDQRQGAGAAGQLAVAGAGPRPQQASAPGGPTQTALAEAGPAAGLRTWCSMKTCGSRSEMSKRFKMVAAERGAKNRSF